MKKNWFIGGISLALLGAFCRILTWDGGSPAWAAALQTPSFAGALLCLYLAGGTDFSWRALQRSTDARARRSLIVGALALLALPVVIWLVYQRYYAELFRALGP